MRIYITALISVPCYTNLVITENTLNKLTLDTYEHTREKRDYQIYAKEKGLDIIRYTDYKSTLRNWNCSKLTDWYP